MFLEFSKERYLKIIFGFFLAILIYSIARIIFQNAIPKLNVDLVKSTLLIYIFAYQTLRTNKTIRLVNFSMLALYVLSILFLVMHWPFSYTGIIISFGVVWTGLIIDSITNLQTKKIDLLIQLFTLIHFLSFLSTNRIIPGTIQPVLWLIETLIIGCISLCLLVVLFITKTEIQKN